MTGRTSFSQLSNNNRYIIYFIFYDNNVNKRFLQIQNSLFSLALFRRDYG